VINFNVGKIMKKKQLRLSSWNLQWSVKFLTAFDQIPHN